MTKMFRYAKSFGLVAMAIFLSGALLLGSVVPAKAEPQKVVKIGVAAPFTGAMADLGVPVNYGFIDAVKYLNELQSIEGLKVECTWYDIQYSISRMIIAHKRFREEGIALEFCVTSTLYENMPDMLVRDEIPVLCGSPLTVSVMAMPKPKWFFPEFPTWIDIFGVGMIGIKRMWTEERPVRIAFMGYDHPVVREAVNHGQWLSTKLGGVEFLGFEIVPFTAIDTSTEWLRLAAKKPDWVWVLSYAGNMVVQVKDYHRLEIRKRGIEFCSTPAGIDETIIRIVRKSGEGVFAPRHTPTTFETEEWPGLKVIHEIAKRYRGTEPEDVASNYILGANLGQIAFEAIRIAAEKVGVENVTGLAVRDSLASFRGFRSWVFPPFSMSDDKPYFVHYIRTYQVKQGKLVPIGDWYKAPYMSKELE